MIQPVPAAPQEAATCLVVPICCRHSARSLSGSGPGRREIFHPGFRHNGRAEARSKRRMPTPRNVATGPERALCEVTAAIPGESFPFNRSMIRVRGSARFDSSGSNSRAAIHSGRKPPLCNLQGEWRPAPCERSSGTEKCIGASASVVYVACRTIRANPAPFIISCF